MKILHVVGARPNFMKVAPLMRAIEAGGGARQLLVHTGQHYGRAMSGGFFEELALPEPAVDLGVGSGTHADQTAEVMKRFDPVLTDFDPDVVVVVGDVNSTIACALVATKRHVPVAHVEAGLRSGDRRMPEEINRLLTDQIAEALFTTSRDADTNLLREGVRPEWIHFVGNTMIDTLVAHLDGARALGAAERRGLEKGYVLVTLHRPSNVDEPEQLREIFEALAELASGRQVVFPMHPRTRASAARYDLMGGLGAVQVIDPLGYLEMIGLVDGAGLVLTDSGGVQEETTFLGVPCLTLRSSTERPVTITEGTNRLVPVRSRVRILDACSSAQRGPTRPPEGWDGRAAERIAAILAERFRDGRGSASTSGA